MFALKCLEVEKGDWRSTSTAVSCVSPGKFKICLLFGWEVCLVCGLKACYSLPSTRTINCICTVEIRLDTIGRTHPSPELTEYPAGLLLCSSTRQPVISIVQPRMLWGEVIESNGYAVAQKVSSCLPTTAAQVRSRTRSCVICSEQSSTGIGFIRVLRFPLPSIPPTAPHSSSIIIIRVLDNRPVVASVIVNSVPLHRKKSKME
jgi:hypothetical protein